MVIQALLQLTITLHDPFGKQLPNFKLRYRILASRFMIPRPIKQQVIGSGVVYHATEVIER